jgi:L-fuconolactonase
MRIDAHHHLWNLAVRPQPWTDRLPALRRSFGMDDLRPLLRQHAIDGTVLVQTVTEAGETPELLAIAASAPEVLGVVGWVDLTGQDVAAQLAGLRALPGSDLLVGVRHQVQLESDLQWLLRPAVIDGLRQVAEAGLVYEILVTRRQLEATVAVVRRIPQLRFVLDHAGKPGIAAGELDPWRRQLTELGSRPNVAVKLSGLVTEAAPGWTTKDLTPYADHLLESFGPGRVMAGSDWPVCLLQAGYDEVITVTDELLADLTGDERAQVLGGTAERWYGLQPRDSGSVATGIATDGDR